MEYKDLDIGCLLLSVRNAKRDDRLKVTTLRETGKNGETYLMSLTVDILDRN